MFDTVVMSGDDVCCSVVFGTLVGVFVFSVMWSEELKLLIHDTHADIITIQETKLTPKAKTPKIHNFTAVRTDRLHKAGGGLITLIRDNITFTTTDIPSTINTHNTELQMVKVHINNTKHITIANIYIPPRAYSAMNSAIGSTLDFE